MLRLLLLLVVVASTARAEVDVDGGVPRTARAVRAAVKRHRLKGHAWLGKLHGVGGGRDTLVYVPPTLDATRTIDVVIYMEGIGSFSDAAIESRHVSSIARLHGNTVYVAPDSPSSSLGERASDNEHWQAGCAEVECEGGVAAPGDFVVFLDNVRSKIAATISADHALDLRVSLIGFSRGGKGVLRALEQLAAVKFDVGGKITIGDVIFADGNYLDDALDGSWAILAERPEAPRMTILVGAGDFSDTEKDGNRRRAFVFWKVAAPDAPLPTADHATSAPRLRLIPLRADHFAIGDKAVDFLARPQS